MQKAMHNKSPMKAITLRNLPPELQRVIRRKAEEWGASISRAVIGLLEESTGIRDKKKKVVHHDLDALAGSWTREESSQFEHTLAEQRGIDPDLWK